MSKDSSKISRSLIGLSLILFTALWLSGANGITRTVRAQGQCLPGQTSLTVMSGSGGGVAGTLDPQVQISTDGGLTFQSATLVNRFILDPFSWAVPIAGTQWLSINTDLGGSAFQSMDIFFRTTFVLPASFSSPTLTIQVHSDNVATILLNGNQIGMQPDIVQNGSVDNFQDPPESFTTTSFFQPLTNELTFKVHNYNGAVGLDFTADICYSPAQGCVDQNPPAVSCRVEEDDLWPPNHDLENVGLKATITDDCDCFKSGEHDGDDDDDDDDGDSHKSSSTSINSKKGKSSGTVGITSGKKKDDGDDDDDDDDNEGCRKETTGGTHSVQVLVYSDEPDLDIPGSGNFSPDAKNIGLGTLRLREERSGNGDGRVYLIVVKATDASGKSGFCVKTVTVPHDQSKASKNSVQNQANAAKTYFMNHSNTPPPNFVQVGTGPVVGPKQ